MKYLAELLHHLEHRTVVNARKVRIEQLAYDSRRVCNNSLFFCLKGERFDGHDFALEAVERGAVALVVERELPMRVPQIVVPNTRKAMSRIAAAFYDNPSTKLKVIAVTGTNGKTSTTYMIKHVLEAAGCKVGVIGTLGVMVGDEKLSLELSTPTTPESADLQLALHTMREAGCSHVVMEVSSHALVTARVDDVTFDTAVFTNLTHDHLDYHRSLEAYRDAKAELFRRPLRCAVINKDDPVGQHMAGLTDAFKLFFSLNESNSACLTAEGITIASSGTCLDVCWQSQRQHVCLPIVGRFNIYNALAALGVALVMNIPLASAAEALASFPGVPGRFELIRQGQDFAVIVDYAHTPDALENVLRTAREFSTGKLIVVFGCGGDRDRAKRPKMGRVAAELADVVIVTSDNPRGEDPDAIITDILSGIGSHNVLLVIEPDRSKAIAAAIGMAQRGDTVVVAGKGHETYQIIGSQVLHFDDREVAKNAIIEVLKHA